METYSSWGEASGFPGDTDEDLEIDYSGCMWRSSLCEFPTWTDSLEKTFSENCNDVLCVPNPLTPQRLVASNTSKVEPVDMDRSVPVDEPISKVEVSPKNSPASTYCCCCLCVDPVNFVLPVVECNTLGKEKVETSKIPVLTSNSTSLVKGYFSGDSIGCHNTVVDSTFTKVGGRIKDRYKIPQVDPLVDPSETFKKTTTVEIMSYLLGLYVDIIPKDLAALWSQIIGRSVTAPERFGLTSLTSQEMLKLKKQYLSEKGDKSDNEKADTCEWSPQSVSTCMSHSLMSHFSLPHVAVVVEQIGLHNLNLLLT